MTRSPEDIDPIDQHVGTRIQLARKLSGQSQSDLAEKAGKITFQQVQKYESGANRVSCSRLLMIARALEKPVGFFFEGLPEYPVTTLSDNASLRIVERLNKLSERQRAAVTELIEAVSAR